MQQRLSGALAFFVWTLCTTSHDLPSPVQTMLHLDKANMGCTIRFSILAGCYSKRSVGEIRRSASCLMLSRIPSHPNTTSLSTVLIIFNAYSGFSTLLIAARLFPYILAMSHWVTLLRHLVDDGDE
eukprot:752585-Hanusia_phi.AAC.2